ncbi:ribosome maturation factor RimM [Pyrinomonas methylaliphatogenes]|jgi:16S rRNA processing protein RimM|uniref:Ribosome maturation factor RimM n=1 Tax=Pyrinomonas methylaliphatogenes TaxID=454194 RepID=A0A0B6WUX8_9BACT|nr:ribosome maturation factor RimM [Pyrinomonas methylaliphatogenes]CDM64552.1 16S rRNA processing protein RimM [Pyrinomonas methylaliphatogenes]
MTFRDETTRRDDLVAVARIVRTRGRRGEVVAEMLTDFPDRFAELERLIAIMPGGEARRLELEESWFHQGRLILKFAGYDSIERAEELVGCELAVTEAECVPLGEGEFYEWQLEGCRVETVAGDQLGRVRAVWQTGGTPNLIVDDERRPGRDYLIPLAEEICVEIDTRRKLIRVDAPEGLLDL